VIPCARQAAPGAWPHYCSRDQIAALQGAGATLVDAREAVRYRGEHEPIDPVAGHIPGAVNLPWQGFSDAQGGFLDEAALRARWGELLQRDSLIVYCGSGVSACVNLLSLAVLGREDALLYGGSWSDWCTYL
jgi:thiosulfate/3-mercaptopyruvate sulfurtransferase